MVVKIYSKKSNNEYLTSFFIVYCADETDELVDFIEIDLFSDIELDEIDQSTSKHVPVRPRCTSDFEMYCGWTKQQVQ